MKKGIKITQEIKDKNNNRIFHKFVINSEIGDIVETIIPDVFNLTEPVAGGYKTRIDLHKKDGFKDIIIPEGFNDKNQKLGDLVEKDENTFTYKVIEMSQEEIDNKKDSKNENEARVSVDDFLFNGQRLILKCRAKIWRRINKFNGPLSLTKTQAAKLERWFEEIYINLIYGNFREARNNIDKLIEERGDTGNKTLNETEGMKDTAEWFQNEILQYFNDKYDM